MNELKIFNNPEFGQVRTIVKDDEIWFVGKDVAEALGYTKPDAMYRVIDNMDKLKINPQSIDFTSFPQNRGTLESNPNIKILMLINESGLYQAIFNSTLPTAKKFKHWVTSEVLPSIRKHGGYVVNKPMNQLEILAQSVKILQEQEQKLAEHDTRIEKIENNVNEIKELEKMNVSNWRLYFGTITRKIAQYYPILENENPYHVVRSEFYRLLEAEAHCDLTRRLKYKKERAYKSGFSKTRINEINKLDVIQEDNRLVNSAIAVLKKMSIQYGFN